MAGLSSLVKGVTRTLGVAPEVWSGLGGVDKTLVGMGALGGGLFAGEALANPIVKTVGGAMNARGMIDSQVQGQAAMMLLLKKRRADAERLARVKAENEAALASQLPDVYNQVVTGKRLPKGAVVIGGSPRRDLVDRLTGLMAQGAFQQASGFGV